MTGVKRRRQQQSCGDMQDDSNSNDYDNGNGNRNSNKERRRKKTKMKSKSTAATMTNTATTIRTTFTKKKQTSLLSFFSATTASSSSIRTSLPLVGGRVVKRNIATATATATATAPSPPPKTAKELSSSSAISKNDDDVDDIVAAIITNNNNKNNNHKNKFSKFIHHDDSTNIRSCRSSNNSNSNNNSEQGNTVSAEVKVMNERLEEDSNTKGEEEEGLFLTKKITTTATTTNDNEYKDKKDDDDGNNIEDYENKTTQKNGVVAVNGEEGNTPNKSPSTFSSSSFRTYNNNNDDNDNNDHDHDHYELSEYEKLRLRNIERNNTRLAKLGLLSSTALLTTTTNIKHNNRRRHRRKQHQQRPKIYEQQQEPLRRSSRNRNNTSTNANSSNNINNPPISIAATATAAAAGKLSSSSPENNEEKYRISPLLQYDMIMNRRQYQQQNQITTPTVMTTVMTSNDQSSSSSTMNSNIDEGNNTTTTISSSSSSNNNSKNGITTTDNHCRCLTVMRPRLIPPKGLDAIYSLEFWNNSNNNTSNNNHHLSNWLVGAGKSGMIAVWDANPHSKNNAGTIIEEEETQGEEKINSSNSDTHNDLTDTSINVDPILSWKAHGGRWIADAKFLPPSSNTVTDTNNITTTNSNSNSNSNTTAPSRLVTAGNDGTLCIWDLSTVSFSTDSPKLLYRTGKKSYHTSGIFCMDTTTNTAATSCNSNWNINADNNAMICTGSKDKSVIVTSLDSLLYHHQGHNNDDSDNSVVLWRSRFHTAKVGAVKFQGSYSTVLVSASDDGYVALHDYRTSSIVAKLDYAHVRPHSVLWDPYPSSSLSSSSSIFVTAGLDPIIKTWDQRYLSEPLFCLQGHVPISTTRCKKIHRPVFYNFGDHHSLSSSFLLTGGQGSSFVSMYKLERGLQQQERNGRKLVTTTRNNNNNSSLHSRAKLPLDCSGSDAGCIATSGKQMAVSVDHGEVILLEPSLPSSSSSCQ